MATEKVMISEHILQDTADSIRAKLNTEDKVKPSEFASKIDEMNVAPKIEKGIIINEVDENGYIVDLSIVGMTEIPSFYLYDGSNGGSSTWFSKSLTTINFPNNLTKISSDAFRGLHKWNATELPDSITKIDIRGFYSCKGLQLTKLPANLSSVGVGAFNSCSSLAIKEIPIGVTVLPSDSFISCKAITEITCLGDMTSIANAFMYNSNMSKLVLPNVTTVTKLTSSSCFYSTLIANGTGYIYVPDALVEDFKVATNWSTYAAQIKSLSELEVSE